MIMHCPNIQGTAQDSGPVSILSTRHATSITNQLTIVIVARLYGSILWPNFSKSCLQNFAHPAYGTTFPPKFGSNYVLGPSTAAWKFQNMAFYCSWPVDKCRIVYQVYPHNHFPASASPLYIILDHMSASVFPFHCTWACLLDYEESKEMELFLCFT